MELRDYISMGIEKAGGPTAFAHQLEQNEANIRAARNHKRGLPNYACIKLAQLIGVDPLEVIAASELVTEKNEARRAVFLPFVHMQKMVPHLVIAGVACSTLLANAASLIKDI